MDNGRGDRTQYVRRVFVSECAARMLRRGDVSKSCRLVARRGGRLSSMGLLGIGSVVVVVLLSLLLMRLGNDSARSAPQATANTSHASSSGGGSGTLFVYCAAGMQYPMEAIVDRYEKEYGVSIELQYGGSNTLLNQLEVSKTGDLYLAADDSYIQIARSKGLLDEAIPLAHMRPVIAVRAGNPKGIRSVDDLLSKKLRVGMGEPSAAAVGKKVRKLLAAAGKWEAMERLVRERGVFKPTVNEVANAIKIGSIDAGLIWDSTVAQYPELEEVRSPELDAGESLVQIGVLRSSRQPTAALHFARYVAARDRGLEAFRAKGFRAVEGDIWEDHPRLVFFAGSVNQAALEPIVREFERREGVTVETVYNGCGILTAQMQTLKRKGGFGFPDAYMACDVYYLDTVRDLFQEDVIISETDIVIVVQKGNPKQIASLSDLVRPGIRVAIGQPDQCTIGVLSRRLLQRAGIYEQCLKQNVVTQTATSAMLVPTVVTGSADAALAYRTDTLAERSRVDVVSIDSDAARAVQPFAISRISSHKQLVRRLLAHVARSKEIFEQAGFAWRLREGSEGASESKRDGAS